MSNPPFLSNCSADTIREAAAALKAGHLVAFPTETVYGLGADARNPDAVKRIYEVKGRPIDHPLIVHISSISQLGKWAIDIPEYAISLARAFWPGPMTLILKRTDIAKDFITGGQKTIGLRVPSNPIALALIQEFERISDSAIAAPSANRFGQVSSTSSDDVNEELGPFLLPEDTILDGGISIVGIESTIISCTTSMPKILRPGAVTIEQVESLLKTKLSSENLGNPTKFSGSFEKHYAPKTRVMLNSVPNPGSGLIALSEVETPDGVLRLASPQTVTEFAKELYSALREADRLGLNEVVVKLPEDKGIGIAIIDRLIKASQGR
jgi:L-threonylcarbamoyladenylate synthase